MDVTHPEDNPLAELHALRREYDAALRSETDPEEKWRLRKMIGRLEERICELEKLS